MFPFEVMILPQAIIHLFQALILFLQALITLLQALVLLLQASILVSQTNNLYNICNIYTVHAQLNSICPPRQRQKNEQSCSDTNRKWNIQTQEPSPGVGFSSRVRLFDKAI